MAWYSVGTVTVTNGSTVVTGAGTDFVSNVTARDGLMVAGGVPLEIASIQSATSLTLASPWLGATSGGQSYKVLPTVGIYVDLALRALNMLTPFQAVIDGIGQGLVPSGSLGAPGLRFTADQDTGVRRVAENVVSIVTGGVDRLFATPNGIGIGQSAPGAKLDILSQTSAVLKLLNAGGAGTRITMADTGYSAEIEQNNGSLIFRVSGILEAARIDTSGNLLVGIAGAGQHTVKKDVAVNSANPIFAVVGGANSTCATFYSVNGAGSSPSAVKSALNVAVDASTSRSINAAGTINASGADYAEYIRKAPNSGMILKGDPCGINRDGELVRTWSDSVRFVVKSTDPNLVGGDTWSAHLPPRPQAPGEAPVEPVAPAPVAPASLPVEPVREQGEDDLDFIRRMAAYLVEASAAVTAANADREALAAYQTAAAAYPEAKAKHDAAATAYEADLAAWEKDLEAARQTVDRIAFSGQVPVNVDDATLAACEAALVDGVAVYLVAVARGAGIGVSAVREGDMTLPLYMRRVGAVWAIRDGRPWVDVQHG